MNSKVKMIDLCKKYCKEKHYGVYRRNKSPYYEHCFRVGDLVSKLTDNEDVVIAAYLHDVLDQGNGYEKEIIELFNEGVYDLVRELTNDRGIIGIKGKLDYMTKKINDLSDDALLIKLCDRYDNLMDVGAKATYGSETLKLIRRIEQPLNDSHKKIIDLIYSVLKN